MYFILKVYSKHKTLVLFFSNWSQLLGKIYINIFTIWLVRKLSNNFSYLAPPVCAIYVQAILFKRINEPGAFWGLMIGLFVGMVRFIWQFSYEEPPCIRSHLDKRPAIISKVHYLHFGIILFIITCVSSWTISLRKHFFTVT